MDVLRFINNLKLDSPRIYLFQLSSRISGFRIESESEFYQRSSTGD